MEMKGYLRFIERVRTGNVGGNCVYPSSNETICETNEGHLPLRFSKNEHPMMLLLMLLLLLLLFFVPIFSLELTTIVN